MKITRTAKIYSQSLLGLNLDKKIIKSEMQNIIETFSDELYDFFANPTIDFSVKEETLCEIFKDKINPELYNFLLILAENGRIYLLAEIFEDFNEKLNEINNILNIEVTSAVELDSTLKQKISEKLSDKLQKAVEPKWLVSDDIIAGLIFKIGDNVIDTSLKYKLENLSKFIK